jgi:CRP/FNR family cyclic AMP-dependent transcriptional regulator
MKTLTLIDKAFLLKKNTLFAGLDIDLLLTIADKMEVESYKKGAKIFEIGQEGTRLYIIVEGIVLIKNSAQNTLAELTSSDTFGDEAALSQKQRAYDALCHTDTHLLTLSQSHLVAILAECPSVSSALIEAYASVTDFRKR